MKKFNLLVVALLIGSASLFAMNNEAPNKTNKEIRAQIEQLLQSSEFTVTEEINVRIKFTFNSEGEIVVLCPGCDNKDVVAFIRENLNHKKIKNPGEVNVIYTVPLTIKQI